MSDPKRANLITVGAPISGKKIVNKTVRLTINLAESNESKYPELNYKELVIAEERKKRVENGRTGVPDPFFENDDDLERAAKQFEQKYGNNSTYGKKKKRSKNDDFADIGAGYDENDSFIDNTDGYDEMIPPDIDTFLGGFYINCGSLEFKTVPHNRSTDEESNRKRRISSSSSSEESSDSSSGSESRDTKEPAPPTNTLHDTHNTEHRKKRRISSSNSSEESSDSSSGSESRDTKEPAPPTNTLHDTHNTEHRKKKNKKVDKQKAKKVRRADSSAATSGKQTSDDTIHPDGEGESVDSRTSHSDSLTSKPAPSSENAITSDSSRDTETKTDVQLPPTITQILEALEASVAQHSEQPVTSYSMLNQHETHIQKLEAALKKCDSQTSRVAMHRAAVALGVTKASLSRLTAKPTPSTSETVQPSTTTAPATYTSNKNKRKLVEEDDLDVTQLTAEQREAMIQDTIRRLMDLIEEFKPSMFANYNMECERVRAEKKKLSSDGTAVDKRLPKRRFPWCHRSRALLSRLTRLAGPPAAAAALLAERVLPLFPKGFVRMPTLMRQANISKDIKVPEMKRQRLGSTTQLPLTIHPPTAPQIPPSVQTPPLFSDQIQFPSSLTVTATVKTSPDKNDKEMPLILNSFSLAKDLDREKSDKKEDIYIPPNNIGSITITPVPQVQKDKKTEKKTEKAAPKVEKQAQKPEKTGLIRVKSPAALNESVKKDAKTKKLEKSYPEKHKEKKLDTPLQIETNFQPTKKEPSPKNKDISPRTLETLSQKQIENLRVKENNIPRPTLVPVHHSPTFAKPEKRPEVKKKEEVKKKKDLMIVSDMDPLSDQEPLAVDDSSSDVEVIENDRSASDVPSKDNKVPKNEADDDFDLVMKNIREMEHSQEPTKLSSNSFGGVITNSNAKHGQSYQRNGMLATRNKDKLSLEDVQGGSQSAERTSLNKTDGCNGVTG